MQFMAKKHGTRTCNLKNYAKRVPFRLILRYFEPIKRSLDALLGCKTH